MSGENGGDIGHVDRGSSPIADRVFLRIDTVLFKESLDDVGHVVRSCQIVFGIWRLGSNTASHLQRESPLGSDCELHHLPLILWSLLTEFENDVAIFRREDFGRYGKSCDQTPDKLQKVGFERAVLVLRVSPARIPAAQILETHQDMALEFMAVDGAISTCSIVAGLD